jgi:CRP-like cAMP-binding protein
VAQQPYGAKAVAASPVKLGVIKNQDFVNLINRYPRIGMNVMRNIAISLGQKLANLDERFYRGVLGSDR